MTSLSPLEENALKLLSKFSELDKDLYHGKRFIEYFDGDIKEASLIFKFLMAHQLIEVTEYIAYVSDSNFPNWVSDTYRLAYKATIAISEYERGENPFQASANRIHNGDIYKTDIKNSSGALAIGKKSVANYHENAEQNAEIAEILKKMLEEIQSLSKSEREDAEYQIQKLSQAAELGSEAIEERKGPFTGWFGGIQERVGDTETILTVYRLSRVLFGFFGIVLPALPEDL
jgi:hypothetical protein